jgi:hypothetical protein
MWKMTTCIGHILQRNYLLKCVFQGKIEGITRWRRRCKQLLGDLKAKRSTRKTKHSITLSGELAFERAMDLSQDKLCNESNTQGIWLAEKLSASQGFLCMQRMAQQLAFLSCISDIYSSKFSSVNAYTDWNLPWFSSVPPVKCYRKVPQIIWRLLRSTSFTIHPTIPSRGMGFLSSALEPTQLYPRGQSSQGMKQTTPLHLVMRLRICEAILALSHTSAWYGAQLSTRTTSFLPPAYFLFPYSHSAIPLAWILLVPVTLVPD